MTRLLVEMLEPFEGRVLDPACGSGGLFVQSAEFVKAHGGRPQKISILGQENNQAGFEHREAERFQVDLRERFAKFALELHAEKTRLIEFGRFAASNRKARGNGRPETFDFLGFTHICAKTRNGQRVRRTLRRVYRYRLYDPAGGGAGKATYAVMIQPGETIVTGDGRRLRVLDVVTVDEEGAAFVGLLKIEPGVRDSRRL